MRKAFAVDAGTRPLAAWLGCLGPVDNILKLADGAPLGFLKFPIKLSDDLGNLTDRCQGIGAIGCETENDLGSIE